MDSRRKQFLDSEAGEARSRAAPPPRRSRLSPVALASLSLMFVFVAVVTITHFSRVSRIPTGPDQGSSKRVVNQWEMQEHNEAAGGGFVNVELKTYKVSGQNETGTEDAAATGTGGADGASDGEANSTSAGDAETVNVTVVADSHSDSTSAEAAAEKAAMEADAEGVDSAALGTAADVSAQGAAVQDSVSDGAGVGDPDGSDQGIGDEDAVERVEDGPDYKDDGDKIILVDPKSDPDSGDYSERDGTQGTGGGDNAASGVSAGDTGSACGALSRELLNRWARNNTVLVAFTNSIMFRNFGDTWLHHVRRAGITYWVLAVADNATAQLVRSRGAHHCFLVHENEIDDTTAAFKWGSRSWQLHTWQKVLAVRHIHHLGFHVINSDMDVVWLRNPLEHFLVKYTAPDYWVSMDPITTQNPLGDDGPELGVSTHHYMNTGVYFLRQTPGGRALIDKWYDLRGRMQQLGFHDQDGLYQHLSKNPQDVHVDQRITRVLEGQTALAQLPATLFQNGYSHCVNQIHKVHKLEPFEVHFVWVWGGNIGKITRMREQRYFVDPPPYYSKPNFLSFDVLPIEDPAGFNDWNDTEAMVQVHLSALTSQLTDAWHGLALAALLNRTVILPKMKCYCIQNWFENPQCRLPGEPLTRFPLTPACPADFVFNMEALAVFNVSGTRVPFREFSFLDNERTPPDVKDRPLVVTARTDVTSPSIDNHTLTIPAGLQSDQLLAALKPYLAARPDQSQQPPQPGQQIKRIHFTNPRLAFGGWSDPRVAEEYEGRVAGLPIRWCCRPDKVARATGKEVHHQLAMKRDTGAAKAGAA